MRKIQPDMGASTQVHEPDLHDHGYCERAGRGHHQPAGQEDGGKHHRGRSAGWPGQLLHELPQGLSGRSL